MKKIIFTFVLLVIALTSYNQTQRRTDNGNNSVNQTEPNRNEKKSTPKANPQQERKAPPPTNSNPNAQKQSNDRSHPTTTINNNHDNSSRDQDSRNRANTQNERTRPNTPADQHDRPNNNDRNHTSVNTTQSVNVNRLYVSHPNSRDYESPRIDRERHEPIHHYDRPPVDRNYRMHHYVYRAPVELNIYWSHELYRNYVRMYPMVRNWNYPIGYHIESVPAYDADNYRGAVMTVYGQINEAYYSGATDEYFLYFGPYYPYQDFTVVMPGWIARQYSRRPELYFENQNLATTGLITTFEEDPEIVVKDVFQLNLY